jgi:hypothetical protein
VLVVNDLAIHYTNKAHIDELLHTLRQSCEGVSVDWEAKLYCRITMNWNYKKRTCELSMPGYISITLNKFKHIVLHTTSMPHNTTPTYNSLTQSTPCHLSMTLPYNAFNNSWAVDNTLLVALSALTSEQSVTAKHTNQSIQQLLDYCYTNPNATIKFKARDMKLQIHSDAGYLNKSKARSRAGGHFYLSKHNNNTNFKKGVILTPTGILLHVSSSAPSEAEYGALFVNNKEGTILQQMLHDMGHP